MMTWRLILKLWHLLSKLLLLTVWVQWFSSVTNVDTLTVIIYYSSHFMIWHHPLLWIKNIIKPLKYCGQQRGLWVHLIKHSCVWLQPSSGKNLALQPVQAQCVVHMCGVIGKWSQWSTLLFHAWYSSFWLFLYQCVTEKHVPRFIIFHTDGNHMTHTWWISIRSL